jgi:serine/threonine protein phosphatase 1
MKISHSSQGNRYVISDIHGCSKTFEALIGKISLSLSDQLFLLGDYIDRGPNSSRVIDFIFELKEQGYQVFTLRGNHEENILTAFLDYDKQAFYYYVSKFNHSANLLDEDYFIKDRYFTFFTSLPYYFELNDCYLVHAGFDFRNGNPFKNTVAMIELRRFYYHPQIMNYKRVIHGHQVTDLETIIQAVEKKEPVIPLDNGCAIRKNHKRYMHLNIGNLCCLNLNTFELILQKNID